jgi:hypothetical protein
MKNNFEILQEYISKGKTVYFELSKSDFSFINKDLKRITEPGEIELIINNQKKVINVL